MSMLNKQQLREIVTFDRRARGLGEYDGRRYGTMSKRALAFCSKHVLAADPYGGMPLCEVFKNYEQIAYWNAADGARVKDGAPTRKTLRYNYIVRGKWTKDSRRREVRVFHVAVRLNREFCPVVKVVATYDPRTNMVQFRDMGYHQLGGWIVYWDRKDYENKAIRAWIYPSGLGEWSDYPCKWGDGLKFPWHETVNPQALEGTRYQYCQYRDGLGTGLCDWLQLYREEPHIENLAKMGLYDFITPFATKALKDKRVFRWVLEHADELKKRCFVKAAIWAAKNGKTLADGNRHFELVESMKHAFSWHGRPDGLRLDYERIAKLLKKWHVRVEDYGRYLCERERNARRRAARLHAKTERERNERLAKLAAERAPEIAAFQESIDRTKTLSGCGYKIVLAKSQDELIKEGKRMGNCVGCGTYGEGLVVGNTLILTMQGADAKERYCVEIDRTNWTVRQCYGRHNSAAPDKVRDLAIRVAESLKAKAKEMRKAKKRRAA